MVALALNTRYQQQYSDTDMMSSAPGLLVLSAADKDSLKRSIEAHSQHIANVSVAAEIYPTFLDSLLYTLDSRRSQLPWRSYARIEKDASLAESLAKMSKPSRAIFKPKAVFVFTGQGAQWAGMGRELIMHSAFRSSLEDANRYLHQLGSEWNLLGTRLSKTELKQPQLIFKQMSCSRIRHRQDSTVRRSVNLFARLCRSLSWTSSAIMVSFHLQSWDTVRRDCSSVSCL